MKQKRLLNAERYLSGFLDSNVQFYVGILYEDYLKSANLSKFGIPTEFEAGKTFTPRPSGPVSRYNKNGKYIRKQPEEKTTKTVEINYVRKSGGKVHYFRDFVVYVKLLQHQYNIPLKFVTNSFGQRLVVSPILFYEGNETSNMKNTHVINLFLEIFQEAEIYTSELEPAIPFTDKYDFEILKKGVFDNEGLDHLVESSRRFVSNPEKVGAFQKRLKTIQKFEPEIIGKGPSGFRGYIVFGFPNKDLVILESMHSGNATYIFNYKGYEKLMALDKQNVINNKLAKQRIFHLDNWDRNIQVALA